MGNPITLQELIILVEDRMKVDRVIESYDRDEKLRLEKIHKYEQEQKLSATDGCDKARIFIRNRIKDLLAGLKEQVRQDNIDSIISTYSIDYYTNLYSGPDTDFRMQPVDMEIRSYFKKYSIRYTDSFDIKIGKLAQIVYQELYGYSILDELIFESEFNEVACNRYDYIWIQFRGVKRRIPNPDFRFPNEQYYNRIIENRLTASAREEMNAGEPFINCTLKNGFRITAARPPLSRHFVVNIRLFTYKDTAHELRSRFMEDKMLKLVEVLARKGRRNIAIIGEQGSGKTTAADELIIKNLDDNLSIGLAEYTHELNIGANHPDRNVVELQYGKQYQPSDITEMFFRFNRDILVYGEVRSPSEAFEMIKAMLRQARGSLFTFHSSSVRRMIHDLRQLLMQTGFYTDYREAQFDVADAVDLTIQIKLDRSTGKRYVYRISEVTTGGQDMSFEISDLFLYDKERDKYLVNEDGISDSMINSCLEYEMTSEDASYVAELFHLEPEDMQVFEYMRRDG